MVNISNNTSAFYDFINKPQSYMIKKENANNKKKVIAASVAGSAVGIIAATAGVFSLAKGKNPGLTLNKMVYDEKDALIIGAGSVLGGLIGGLVSDKNKENKNLKLREASQQFFGNMTFPITILAGANKLLDKSGFKLPKINSSSKPAGALNVLIEALPKMVVCIASLVGGMELGNKVMNRVNNKIFKEEIKHDVKAEDYLVHADDICLTANMLLKDFKSISAVTSKLLPLSFIVAGSKTGIQQKEN